VKILRLAYIVVALLGVLLCYCDYALHAQTPDPYTNAAKLATNTALIDQIQIHDADTNRKFEDINKRFDDINSRISFIEGSAAGFGGLLGLLQIGILVIPRIKLIRGGE
jgi:tetrahydromethanopterin S-methyltransferase subunit G